MPKYNATVAYIYSDTPAYVRAKKNLGVLTKLFSDVHFIGCKRKHEWDKSSPENVECHIDDRVLGNGISTFSDVLGYCGYIKQELKKIKPDIVIAVNEEYIIPFTLGYLPKPKFLVLDLYDSIGMRVTGPLRHLNPLWRLLSSLAMKTIDGLAEVTEERLGWHWVTPKSTTVLYNSPDYVEDIKPLDNLPAKNYIYASGTFVDNLHGVEHLYEAIEKVDDVHVIVTGKPSGDFVRNVFLKHPKVHNLGTVPYEDVPRIAAGSLAVYAHYNPVRLNYVYGAPNKLYEAMMVARPVLINSENMASKLATETGMGLVSPYGDADALANDLRSLLTENSKMDSSLVKARELFCDKYDWDKMASKGWTDLYEDMKKQKR